MNNEPVYWKTKDGRLLDVDEMEESHVRNTLKMLIRNMNSKERAKEDLREIAKIERREREYQEWQKEIREIIGK